MQGTDLIATVRKAMDWHRPAYLVECPGCDVCAALAALDALEALLENAERDIGGLQDELKASNLSRHAAEAERDRFLTREEAEMVKDVIERIADHESLDYGVRRRRVLDLLAARLSGAK